MTKIVLITGNQGKADQLKQWLGRPIAHQKIDLAEIQSLELREVVAHKAAEAYRQIGAPVLVEDVEVRCSALHGLPGPLIKWFIQSKVGLLCQMLNAFDDRSAVARVMYALHDGHTMYYFEGEIAGEIAKNPAGDSGFGWDTIFIPQGYARTRAELNEAEYEATSPRAKAIVGLRQFLDANPTLAA